MAGSAEASVQGGPGSAKVRQPSLETGQSCVFLCLQGPIIDLTRKKMFYILTNESSSFPGYAFSTFLIHCISGIFLDVTGICGC